MDKAGIRKQVKSVLNRNDVTDEEIGVFIDQSATRIQRTLRIPPMELSYPAVSDEATGGNIMIPQDFLSMKFLYAGSTLLEYLDIGRFLALPKCVGNPRYYTRVQGQLKLSPTPPVGTEVTFVYYSEAFPLVADTDRNFLTDATPDLLVYGALAFAAVFFVDERKQAFEDEYRRVYEEVTEQALLTEMETSGMAIAPAYDLEY